MRKRLQALLLLSSCTSFLYSSPLKSDEHVLFLPGIAYIKDDHLYVEVSAWIYENERRIGFNALLRKYLGIQKSSLSPEEQSYFDQQTALFKVDSERHKSISVRFSNGELKTLPNTNRAGRSSTLFKFNRHELPLLITKDNTITFTLDDPKHQQHLSSYAIFSDDTGYLVISDIDDTIKDSAVLDTKTLLKNTFLYPPKTTHGMPQRFKELEQSLPNPLFVYVSSSPIQLYPTLHKFIDEHYPKGLLKLRQSTAWNEVIASKAETMAHKTSSITDLLEVYPNKRVVLFGDSGEHDPEIYLDIAQRYPQRIEQILIRDVTHQAKDHERYQNFPTDLLTILAP